MMMIYNNKSKNKIKRQKNQRISKRVLEGSSKN